jgi:hypothetical protein
MELPEPLRAPRGSAEQSSADGRRRRDLSDASGWDDRRLSACPTALRASRCGLREETPFGGP